MKSARRYIFILVAINTFVADVRATSMTNVETLNDDQLIGQMLMIGVGGTEFNSTIADKIQRLQPGGIIFFGRNIKSPQQISRFLYDVQTYNKKYTAPLFLAVDQEGGAVTRLKSWPPMPSAATLGKADSVDLSYRIGLLTGQILKTIGFNMNLAPVLDVSDPESKSFIGTRAISSDPAVVAKLGSALVSGYEHAGVVTVSKHFPGHGTVVSDTHRTIASHTGDINTLKTRDLVPFYNMSKVDRLPAVMVAHLSYPSLDPTETPGTYSDIIMQKILRQSFNYNGIVMTDDLEMSGAKGIRDPGERAIRSVLAGADVIMVAWNPSSQERAHFALKEAMLSGRISRSRIKESVSRILQAKDKYGLNESIRLSSNREIQLFMRNTELEHVTDLLFWKGLEKQISQPQWNKNKTVYVVSQDASFGVHFKTVFKKSRTVLLSAFGSSAELNAFLDSKSRQAEILFYVNGPDSIKAIKSLSGKLAKRVTVVSSEPRYRIGSIRQFKAIATVLSRHPELGRIVAAHLEQKEFPSLQARSEEWQK